MNSLPYEDYLTGRIRFYGSNGSDVLQLQAIETTHWLNHSAGVDALIHEVMSPAQIQLLEK